MDDELLGPPVDYHEVRGHLRIGTVRIADKSLLAKIQRGALVTEEEDIAIRTAVFRAIWWVSSGSGLRNPSQLHYYFWNMFRAICLRHDPRCSAGAPAPGLPPRYQVAPDFTGTYHCPFERDCISAHAPQPLIEHAYETEYY